MNGNLAGRKGVSLERLQTLCLVAQAGSVMAAAKGDPNRQSLYSRQIKELEQALRLQLLDRSTVPHRLSLDGSRIESITREYLEGMDRILAGASGRPPVVTVGAGESIIQWLVLPLLAGRINDRGLRLKFQNLTSRDTVEAIRSRRIDVGVVPAEDSARDLESVTLAKYGVIAVGKKACFGSKTRLKWAQLAGQLLSVPEGRGALRRMIDQLCEGSRDGPEVRLECTSFPQIIEACVEGEVVGILPEVAKLAAKKAGLASCRIEELEDMEIELVLIWNQAVLDSKAEVGDVLNLLKGGAGSIT